MLTYEIATIPDIDLHGTVTRRCAGCGQVRTLEVIGVPGDPGECRTTFDYVHCRGCGTLSLQTEPNNIGDYYAGSYYSFGQVRAPGRLKGALKRLRDAASVTDTSPFAALIRQVSCHVGLLSLRPLFDGSLGRRFTKRDALLDVGCGDGRKLLDLRSIGFSDLTGVDPFMQNPRSERGLLLKRGSLEDLGRAFDIVTFHHSFEHIAEAERTLRLLHAVVDPDGRLVIRIPLAASWAWRQFGGEWAQLDAPRHAHLFSSSGFQALAGRTGWTVERTVYDSGPLQVSGSLLRRKGINVHARPSRAERGFTRAQRQSFVRQARALNRQFDGDQATFFLGHRAAFDAV